MQSEQQCSDSGEAATKWRAIVELALRGDLTVLARRYPQEAVQHFVALKEMALTCGALPRPRGGDTDERLRQGKTGRLYETGRMDCDRVNKKLRLAESPVTITRMEIFHSIIDNESCDVCGATGFHTAFNFDYYNEAENAPEEDYENVVCTACADCTRRFASRDPVWRTREHWSKDHAQRAAYESYRAYGVIDAVKGVYGDEDNDNQ